MLDYHVIDEKVDQSEKESNQQSDPPIVHTCRDWNNKSHYSGKHNGDTRDVVFQDERSR